jgi:hypothetical protein
VQYRGARVDRPVAEFHRAVDLLAADTVPEAYYRRIQQSRRAEQRQAGPLRLLVCGSRHWTDRALLVEVIDQVVAEHGRGRPGVVVIEGAARGADRLAGELARTRGWQFEEYPADWQREGRAAGPRRNARMLREGRPERVLAFTDNLPASRGTAHMVRRACAAGLPVQVISHPSGEEVTPSAPSVLSVEQLPFLYPRSPHQPMEASACPRRT